MNNTNGIHYETYEFRSGRITLILRQDEEVWISDVPPEIVRHLEKMHGKDNLTCFINVGPDLLGGIEFLEYVPRGTVLHSGEMAPIRRLIYKTANTLGEASAASTIISAFGCGGAFLVSLFPPAAPVAVPLAITLGKALLISGGTLVGSAIVHANAESVKGRKRYVRFKGQCIANPPPHKETVARAEFIGTVKKAHYECLCKQLRGYDGQIVFGKEVTQMDLA